MRKLVLILLNCAVLATMAYSQEAVLTAKKAYSRTSVNNPFVAKSQEIRKYDKKICKDTLITEEYYITDNFGQYKNVVTTNKKYDTQSRLTQAIVARTNYSKGLGAQDTFKISSASKKRSGYIYTPSNVRADTLVQDDFSTTSNTWGTPFKSLLRKAGFGYDTVKTTNTYEVWDDKGRNIISKYMRDGKNTSDSTIYKFDTRDRLISEEIFKDNYGLTKLVRVYFRVYVYENDQLAKINVIGGYLNDSTTVITNYYYKNKVQDYEETFTKRRYVDASNRVIIDTSRTRVRYPLYNTAGKCLEKVNELKSNSTGDWLYQGGNKMVYQNDTLLLRDTLTANGVQTLTVYEYGDCTETISGTNEAVQPIDFTVSPNPAHQQVRVQLGDDYAQESAQVSLINVQGSTVSALKSVYNAAVLDVSQLPRGMYFIKITQQNKSTTKKIVLN